MSDTDSDPDVSKLAREVIAELDPGTIIDDRVILSRRQAVGLATGAISLGALSGFGASSAQAQEAAGAVGTEEDRVDLFAANYGSDATATGYEMTIEGDVYEFVEE